MKTKSKNSLLNHSEICIFFNMYSRIILQASGMGWGIVRFFQLYDKQQ